MQTFITGATGVLGRGIVDQLTERGHRVTGVVRDDAGEATVEASGGRPVRADLFDADALADAARGADVVIHAATSLPTKTKIAADDWAENDRVRLEGGQAALNAAESIDAERFVTHSVVWAYRNGDGSPIDVDSAPNPDRTTRSAVEFERHLDDAADGLDTVVLRYGWLYGPESGQTRSVAQTLLDGDLPVIGGGLTGRAGETVVSPIHTVDAAGAMVAAAEAGLDGTYHVVDDEPVTTDAFFGEFANRLDVDEPGRIPGWLARFFVGGDMVRFLTNDFPTSNDRFVEATGWSPRYPTYRAGIETIVETWLDEGQLVVTDDGFTWGDDVPARYECRSCGRTFEPNTGACPHCDSSNRRPVSG